MGSRLTADEVLRWVSAGLDSEATPPSAAELAAWVFRHGEPQWPAVLEGIAACGAEARLGVRGRSVPAEGGTWFAMTHLPALHGLFLDLPKPRPEHPVAPWVREWLRQPVLVEPETRRDKRILPRFRGGLPQPERERGMLFGGLTDGREPSPPQREIPLFPRPAERKRVPILDIVDAAGVPVRARRGGAALEARLFVRTLISIRPNDRLRSSVRIALTLRELRDGLFPRGWNRAQDMPRLRQALLTAKEFAIHDGRGRWWPIALRYLPDAPKLDDLIVLDVAYPPGAGNGPVIDLPALDGLSVESSPRWRATIAAQSVAWVPGKTRVKGKATGWRWFWTKDIDKYPVLPYEDRRQLAFGRGDAKHRTRTEIDAAWQDLPGLTVIDVEAVDAQTGEVGWRILPVDAAQKLTS